MSPPASLTPLLEGALPEFLPRQRWFAGKARPLADVSIEDLAWLSRGADARALALAEARYRDGGRERYCLLLSFPGTDGPALIARDEGPPPGGCVVEAGGDPVAVRALLGGLGSGASTPTDRGGLIQCGDAVPPGDDPRWVDRMLAERAAPLGAEQSNTSVRFSDRYVFKLFRKIDTGENPEVEIGRFLTTRTGFRAMPALRGSVTYRPSTGDPCTLGVLQDWVPEAEIGWNAVIARLRRAAAGAEPADGVAEEMARLGRTTGELHLALGSDSRTPEFAPEAPGAADREAWSAGLAARAERVRQLFAESPLNDPRAIRLRDAFLGHLSRPGGVATGLLPDGTPFQKIRVHGDYHLGQTLRRVDGFVILDFEGEPGRPLEERRLKQCALKDVAGMTRSFDYAWETAREDLDAKAPQVSPVDRMRESFVAAYRAAVRPARPPIVPEGPEAFFAWLDFFEMDKALYEIEYELNNRPGWVHIPLAGAVRILEREAA